MNNLNYAERGILLRRHGLTVTRQVAGVAHCLDANGDRRQYAIDHLRRVAQQTWAERLIDYIAGVRV